MNLHIELNHTTTKHQLHALAAFCGALAADPCVAQNVPAAEVTVVQTQTTSASAEVEQQETKVVDSGSTAAKVTRRRRTKAEIEADEAAEKLATEGSAVADAEALAQKNNETALAAMTDTKQVEVADTKQAETINTDTGEISAGDQQLAANATGEKAYSEGEVQALATLIARSKGPDVVRNKITELGGTRISALTAQQINDLGAFLEAQK